jgi:hypothetical protein
MIVARATTTTRPEEGAGAAGVDAATSKGIKANIHDVKTFLTGRLKQLRWLSARRAKQGHCAC